MGALDRSQSGPVDPGPDFAQSASSARLGVSQTPGHEPRECCVLGTPKPTQPLRRRLKSAEWQSLIETSEKCPLYHLRMSVPQAKFAIQRKKSVTEHGIAERHFMITQAHQAHPQLSVQRLCELFEVSRSWYYEHLNQLEDDAEEIALRDRIEEIILEFAGNGYRRVTQALAREGWQVNHKRVLRIMQEESLLCHLKKRFVIATTNSRHRFPVYTNVLAGLILNAPDQAWVADLTYIRLRSAFVYLACILDAFSRRCVGWHLSREMTTQLTLAALKQAIVNAARSLD